MTLEQTHAALVAEFATYKTKAEADLTRLAEVDKLINEAKVVTAERDTLKAEVATLTAALKEAAEKAVALEQSAKPAALQAAIIVASCGANPANISPDVVNQAKDERSLVEQYNALSGAERTAFYKQHKNELWKSGLTI